MATTSQKGAQPKLFKAFRQTKKDGTVIKKFFEVHDDLENSYGAKIRVKISEFPAGGQGTSVHHSIGVNDARYLCRLILGGRLGLKGAARQYEEYKGGPNPRSDKGYHSPTGFISRHLTVERDAATATAKSVGKDFVVSFTIENGPGERGDKGQVTPVRDQGTPIRATFSLSEQEAMTFAAMLDQYLQSWLNNNFVAVRDRLVEEWGDADTPSGDTGDGSDEPEYIPASYE